MADQHQRIALLGELDRLDVNLGHQRAGSVNHLEAAGLAGVAHRRRNAVGRVDDALAGGDFLDLVDEDRAFFRQLIDHKAVVDDLPANVNGRAKGVEGDLDNVDGANHAGAKAAGFEQKDALLAGGAIRIAKLGTVSCG
jgi:hypothetical protein